MIVCFASLMHILWGVLLLLNQAGLHITATSTVFDLVPNYATRVVLYLAVGILPLVIAVKPRWTLSGLLACFPQLVMLVLSGIAALTAVTSGMYPDGTVRLWLFILMDQGIYMILPVMYAIETLDRFHDQSAAHPKMSKVIVKLGDE